MAKRDYSDTGQRSQSDELFEDIFQLALTSDQKRKKAASPISKAAQKPRVTSKETPHRPDKPVPAPPLQRGQKVQEKTAAAKPAPARGARSRRLPKILIGLVLIAAAGAAALLLLPRLDRSEPPIKPPVSAAIKREIPPKPQPKSAAREPEAPSPEAPAQASSAAATPAPPGRGSEEPGTQAGAAPSIPPPAPPPKTKVPSLPYSVYLGSFKKEEALQKALAIYREKGLSPYVVRMDLGPKGVWSRVFSGHFETREEADSFIEKNQLSDAESKQTRYAVLVGEHASKQQAETRVKTLKDAGCHCYVIGTDQAGFRIYAGAYYRMEDAEKELAWLVSKGVQGRIVER